MCETHTFGVICLLGYLESFCMKDPYQIQLPYQTYASWLKKHYGQKVYKIPVNTGGTCPNRDGTLSCGGCIFCGEKGAGNETLSSSISIKDQIKRNEAYISKRYHADLFIPFLQDFSNTYIDFKTFQSNIEACLGEQIVGISISTRPDCISDQQLDFLSQISEQNHIDICIELGLQTINAKTLRILNRQHSLSDYVDAAMRIKAHHLQLCTHMILDLPWDDEMDVIEGAELLSVLKTDFAKCHALYVERGTKLAEMYQKGRVQLLSVEDYIHRVVLFLTHLAPDIALQRVIGRIPEQDSIQTNWHISWWKIREMLIDRMRDLHLTQGCSYQKNRQKLIGKIVL